MTSSSILSNTARSSIFTIRLSCPQIKREVTFMFINHLL
jgi:hypothetical protein